MSNRNTNNLNRGNNNRGNNNRGNNNRGNNNNNSLFNTNNNRNNNRGNNNSKSSKSFGNSTIFMVLAILLLLVVLGVAGYFIYKHMKGKTPGAAETKQFIPYIHDASIDKRISYGSIPQSSQGNEYNMNLWIYVNDYTYMKDEDKMIMYKGPDPNNITTNSNHKLTNPGVFLLKNVNTLRILIGLDTDYSATDCQKTEPTNPCSDDNNKVDKCEIEHFPLQRWVNLNITLHNNVLDVFFDGKLKKSQILSGSPVVSKNDLFICKNGGFNGYISNFKYSNRALSVKDIEKMYKSGPTLGN